MRRAVKRLVSIIFWPFRVIFVEDHNIYFDSIVLKWHVVFCRTETADLKILISDISTVPPHILSSLTIHSDSIKLADIAKHLLSLSDSATDWTQRTTSAFKQEDTLVVLNKVDLVHPSQEAKATEEIEQWRLQKEERVPVNCISCKTCEGVDDFMSTLGKKLGSM